MKWNFLSKLLMNAILWSLNITIFAGTIALYRGAPTDQSFRYWAVEDTYIDAKKPESNFGREYILAAGPDQTILIRFGDLARVVGRNCKIAKASLRFLKHSGKEAKLAWISRVLVPWKEGSGAKNLFFTRNFLAKLNETEEKNKKEDEIVVGASWKHPTGTHLKGGWDKDGALGQYDTVQISGAHLIQTNQNVIINGLEDECQLMLDRPDKNYGFALQFESPIEFASSDAFFGKPTLELEVVPSEKKKERPLQISWIEVSEPSEKTTYTAEIKNMTQCSLSNIHYECLHSDKKVKEDLLGPLEPGQVARVQVSLPCEINEKDHRLNPVRFISYQENSSDAAVLEIDQNAIPIGVAIHRSNYNKLEQESKAQGYDSVEDWLQSVILFWNESLFAQSRFSFAPEGCTKRVRLQKIWVIPDGENLPKQPENLFAFWKITDLSNEQVKELLSPKEGLKITLTKLHQAMGLPILGVLEGKNLIKNPIEINGLKVLKVQEDLYPGFMGGGDTRDLSGIPSQIPVSYEYWQDSLAESTIYPFTDLYPSSLVALLEMSLGEKETFSDLWPKLMPNLIMIKVLDAQAKPVINALVDFFTGSQTSANVQKPVYSLKTDNQGFIMLPFKNTDAGKNGTPFDPLDSDLKNAYFIIRVQAKGATAFGWLKIWQIADTFARGGQKAGILNIRFELPNVEVDYSQNLARNKMMRDSKGSYPAKLHFLNQEFPIKGLDTLNKVGDWIEIDLGRDRPLSEVSFDVLGDQIWKKFDILIYRTAQKPSDAVIWAREVNGPWSLRTRSVSQKENPSWHTLRYYGLPLYGRYVRMIIREGDASAEFSNLKIFAAAATSAKKNTLSQ